VPFSEQETAYLRSQRLARIATVSAGGQPDVVPGIYGNAELTERQGQFGPGTYMRITPTIFWSFNLDGLPFTHDRGANVRRTVHQAVAN
jgi:pyridoxamine 5'-phosphate oxidase family protein